MNTKVNIKIIIPCVITLSLINLLEYFLLKSPFVNIDTKPITKTIKTKASPIIINIGAIFVKNSIDKLT